MPRNLFQVETSRACPLDHAAILFEARMVDLLRQKLVVLMAVVTLGTFGTLVGAYRLLF